MNSREIALKVLMDVHQNGAFSNYSISKYLKGREDVKGENLIREIVYGVIENALYLDYIISKLSKVKIEKIDPKILEILRIGVYQMAFMDRIPHRAAVNESVNLAKKYGHKGTVGFTNGILRNFSRNKEELMKIDVKDKLDYLSIKYSHPRWMVERWVKEFSLEFTEELLVSNNSKPMLNIRVNTLKLRRDELKRILSDYGYTVYNTEYASDGLIVEDPVRITETEEFNKGYFTIQDESSMLVAQILSPAENSVVLDLCSAPGGKSTHAGQIMNNKGKIISLDIYEHKLKLVMENAERLGITIIETGIHDAQELNKNMVEMADYCIVDAPCSGLGIIKRRPEIKWNRKEEDIKDLADMQKKILNNAGKYLKPGGVMVYSTCTIEKAENMDVIQDFLMKNRNFKLSGFENFLCSTRNADTAEKGYVQLFPNVHGTDGFFIARLIKENI
ncbi:MAG TPA: 16S rRNA (cytosine(967)-C(5))-methyltransferase RsmB [Tissierellia bacterium]|nr:16S rRNA (cytosine(967)-C(5))-methyltransferase RsmB [Tissierellia bacterium]